MVHKPRKCGPLDAKAFSSDLAKIACGFWLLFVGTAFGAPDPARIASICETAASQAAQRYGIPVSVMQALTLTETGRKLDGQMRPWPWTINYDGRGYWFDNLAQAYEFVEDSIPSGVQSYDLGCFQINAKWHGQAFSSKRDMLDPNLNADYAARFLLSLLPEFRTWEKTAGAYHSRTPKFARRYEKLFAAHLSRFGKAEPNPAFPARPTASLNTPKKAPQSMLGQALSWEMERPSPGSLSRLRSNPQNTGLLRAPRQPLF